MSRTFRKAHPYYGDFISDWFKKLKKKIRKAKEKDAFKKGKEDPKFRKTDTWEWN